MEIGGWSERELRSLAAVFDTFVARPQAEARRHAELAAQALSEVAEPADLRQLRLILALFESNVGSIALAHGTRSFSRLPRKRREEVLLRWSTSPIAQRRTFYQTVKRLATFFAYADPGPADEPNPRWSDIGYSRPDEPVAAPSEVGRALVETGAADRPVFEAEIVIVGSGAGGGVAAARLAALGHDVLVVEAGPFVAESDMPVDELTAFNRLYLDHGMTSSHDLGVAILSGSAVGGGTLVNWTTCIDPPVDVRAEWAAEHGLVDFDGASTHGDLARLRDELEITGPTSIGPKDQTILDGAAALGWEAAETERNAVGCGDCGACGFGCRRGAKRSGLRVHLAMAAEHGARVLPNARVQFLTRAGQRFSGLVGELGDGREFEVRAKIVVVAAGALRTPALLQDSGLAHPEIGANLRLHPAVVIGARMPWPVEMWRDTTQAARTVEHLSKRVLIESAPGHPGLLALAFPWQGAAHHAALMRDVRYYAPLVGICRDLGSGRITTKRRVRARIEYQVSERDAVTARYALVRMAELARAAGATRIVAVGTPAATHDVSDEASFGEFRGRLERFDMAPNRAMVFSAHQMGSARAGADPLTSACDIFGRVRSDTRGATVPGLYVADASLFPTALGVNPMITVMAMAERVARAVHEDS